MSVTLDQHQRTQQIVINSWLMQAKKNNPL